MLIGRPKPRPPFRQIYYVDTLRRLENLLFFIFIRTHARSNAKQKFIKTFFICFFIKKSGNRGIPYDRQSIFNLIFCVRNFIYFNSIFSSILLQIQIKTTNKINVQLILIIDLYIALFVSFCAGPSPPLPPCSGSKSGGYNCCDQLQVNCSPQSNDCTCSDQTGGVGTCSCSSTPNSRQGWLCIKNSNGDSVNIEN